MGGLHGEPDRVIGALGRITVAGALILVAAALTNGATKWVMGPGTRAPDNPYRYPLFDFNQREGFDNDGNFYALVSGWRIPEPWGVWSNGPRAALTFRLRDGPPLSGESRLILHLKAYLAPPYPPVQHFSVWQDKTKLGEATLVVSDTTITFPLNGVTLPRDPTPVMLQFEIAELSIGLISLEITR
jgi:hypothetical protein